MASGRDVCFSTLGTGASRPADASERAAWGLGYDDGAQAILDGFRLIAVDAVSDPSVLEARLIRESREMPTERRVESDGVLAFAFTDDVFNHATIEKPLNASEFMNRVTTATMELPERVGAAVERFAQTHVAATPTNTIGECDRLLDLWVAVTYAVWKPHGESFPEAFVDCRWWKYIAAALVATPPVPSAAP